MKFNLNKISTRLTCLFYLLLLTPISGAADKTTVLVIGDSLSVAYGLQEEQGWISLLQQQLDKSGDHLEFINDSISGDTTTGGVLRTREMLARIQPNWLIVALGANDGLRGSSLSIMQNNLLSMVEQGQQAGAKVVVLGMRLPPNYGRTYTRGFEAVYTNVADQKNVPLLPFFIEGVGGMPELNQADGFHPIAEGQIIIKNTLCRFLLSIGMFEDVELEHAVQCD